MLQDGSAIGGISEAVIDATEHQWWCEIVCDIKLVIGCSGFNTGDIGC